MINKSDIFLVSYPKSGNTFFRFLWVNMISSYHFKDEIVDFKKLNSKYIAEYDSNRYSNYNYFLPRLVKSHKKYDNLKKFKNHKIYIHRHPADVMISFFNYKNGNNIEKIRGSFSNFIKSHLDKWIDFNNKWMESESLKITYEDLKNETMRELKKTLYYLEIDVPEEIIKASVQKSSFQSIRKIEENYGLGNFSKSKGFLFTRNGECKQYIDFFTNEEKELFNEIMIKNKTNYLI